MLVLAIPDCHVPYHHARAFDWALKQIRLTRPDHVIQLGDFADFKALSMHAPEFGDRSSLEEELPKVRAAWAELEDSCDHVHAKLSLLEGNHETRLQRYAAFAAKKLETLIPTTPELFGASEHVEFFPYQTELVVGKVRFVHDIGYAGPSAARQTLEAMQHNVVFGHTHRADTTYSGTVDGTRHFAMTCGWLGDGRHVTYVPQSKTRYWTLGVGVVQYSEAGFARARFEPFPGKY